MTRQNNLNLVGLIITSISLNIDNVLTGVNKNLIILEKYNQINK